ncbi:MAG: sigma-54-dependent transcriptional regulator [Candidatus Binatia bacterium]
MTKLTQQNATQMPLDGSCSPRILLINSDTMVCQQLQRLFSQCAYSVSVMQSGQDALEIIADGSTDLVLTDLHVPDLDGMKFVERIRRLHADVPVIVLTREKDIELAVKALKLGVSDYISMPFSADAVRESTRSALEKAQVFTELRHMRRGFAESFEFVGMVSRTPEMHRVFETIRMVSNMDVTVLVEGETGTGKELVAKAIHDRSARREGKFVTINCAGVPDALLESELFGFERGAFTGADHSKEGMIELAHGGTLFLDEIESMSLSMQAKLLHVIEDRKVQRLGGNRKYDIDMRVIAATNVPAKELVAERKMRNDFYYRINVVSIQLLPLRQRRADIPLLVQNFLRKHPFAAQKGIMEISRQAMSQLMHHSWPGNFRELQNVLEKAVVLAVLPVIDKVDILDEPPPPGIDRASKSTGITFAQWIREQEKAYLVKQLEAFHGSIDRAAANSGICVRTLFRKMRLYGLDKKQFRSQAPEISLPPEVSSVIENKVSATNPHFRH